MINVRLTVALPGSAQLYAMQCERADNDRAAGCVMRVERHRWSSHDTQHMPGQARVGPVVIIGIPRFQLNLWKIARLNCLSLFLWSVI